MHAAQEKNLVEEFSRVHVEEHRSLRVLDEDLKQIVQRLRREVTFGREGAVEDFKVIVADKGGFVDFDKLWSGGGTCPEESNVGFVVKPRSEVGEHLSPHWFKSKSKYNGCESLEACCGPGGGITVFSRAAFSRSDFSKK